MQPSIWLLSLGDSTFLLGHLVLVKCDVGSRFVARAIFLPYFPVFLEGTPAQPRFRFQNGGGRLVPVVRLNLCINEIYIVTPES